VCSSSTLVPCNILFGENSVIFLASATPPLSRFGVSFDIIPDNDGTFILGITGLILPDTAAVRLS
jgi:hypothetical protein